MIKFDLKNIKAEYELNGAVVIRNAISQKWLDDMQRAIDYILENPGSASIEYTPSNKKGRYYGDFFIWMRNSTFKSFAFNSNLPEIAAKLLNSKKINFFYDQLLVKEPNTSEITPWHHDLPYWPISGQKIISFWVAFDEVNEDSGAVKYIKGSHKWNKFYAPTTFGKSSGNVDLYNKMGLETIPDINANLDDYDILSWDLKPGDAIIHHPLTIHGSSGNKSLKTRRRGLALRYIGDDVIWDDRPGTFINNEKIKSILPNLDIKGGDSLDSEVFPKVWESK
ncbi:MAG: hypothetical protein CMJ14_08400 [Pelagibacterales bacterium]|nr:hypothetical protein [Pelagibacterales bacterium]|tara:strand:+ start:634 stop:1473 length:840 start_codon:yes stop_codon:yes gene_type:complete